MVATQSIHRSNCLRTCTWGLPKQSLLATMQCSLLGAQAKKRAGAESDLLDNCTHMTDSPT